MSNDNICLYNLFIVESPAKCNKIEQYLGPGNKCIASYGHFRELNGLQSININKQFEPSFIVSESKQTQVNKVRKFIKGAREIFLASDDDREGEAIAWHICDYFGLSLKTTKRIVFHEVTESAIKKAVIDYRYVNMDIVQAQLARQVLDVLVGYKCSPILWKNVKDGTSAGRCQTPALRLIYDNYKEIKESPGSKEYNTTGYFTSKNIPFVLNHHFIEGAEVNKFLKESMDFSHVYTYGDLRDNIKHQPSPFTTSKIQQVASTNLHTSPKETMKICQKLYEEGFITYMRTDSAIYAEEFVESAIVYIEKEYGKDYIRTDLSQINPKQTDMPLANAKQTSKKSSKKQKELLTQDAHEAIRPTDITVKTLDASIFTSKECKMYQLIWSNTLESCMAPALYKGITGIITAPQTHVYKVSAEQVVFPGWKIVNGCDEVNKEFVFLQTLKQSSIMKYKKITAKVSMKELKTHYTEAKLVHLLEQEGIGRPSTFSSLIDKIQERGYVKKENVNGVLVKCIDYELDSTGVTVIANDREFGNEKNKLVIKPLGIMVLEYLVNNINAIFEYDYTKNMETQLDLIAQGKKVWYELCKECLTDLDASIKSISQQDKGKESIRIDNEHIYIMGKYGPVIKCIKPHDNVTFKSVKPDIDLEKLRKGEYTLQDVILNTQVEDTSVSSGASASVSSSSTTSASVSSSSTTSASVSSSSTTSTGRSLGMYKTKEVVLKSGKFGWYIEWGTEKKALKLNLEEATALTLDDVADTLFDIENGDSLMIRVISKETSIRKGKYGDYIFHKNNKMKKPKFLKLNEFKEDYKTCDIEIIHMWLKKTYDINKCV